MTPGARDGGHYERDYTAKQTWLRPQLSLLTVGVGPGMIGGRTPAGSKRSAGLFDHSLRVKVNSLAPVKGVRLPRDVMKGAAAAILETLERVRA